MISSSWNPFAATFITLHTRLSPEECTRRLQKVTLPWISSVLVIPLVWSTLPLLGWVYATGFAVRKRALPAAGLQPEAKANFVVTSNGTRMTVRVGTRRRTLFAVVSFLAFLFLYIEGVLVLCRYEGDPRCLGASAFTPFIVPALFGALQLWAWWQTRDEAAFLVTFLKQTLEADEVGARHGR